MQPPIYIQESDALSESLRNTLDFVTDIVEDVAVLVWLIDQNQDRLVARVQSNVGSGSPDLLVLNRQTDNLVIRAFEKVAEQEADNLSDESSLPFLDEARARRWQSALIYPLQTEQVRFGVLGIFTIGYRGFTKRVRQQIQGGRELIISTLENQQIYEQISYQANAFEKLSQVSGRLSSFQPTSTAGHREFLQEIVESAREVLNADLVTLYEYYQEDKRFELPQITTGKLFVPEIKKSRIRPDDTLLDLIKIDRPQYMSQAQEWTVLKTPKTIDEDHPHSERFITRENIISTAIVPVMVEAQRAGLLFINYRHHQAFPPEQRNIIEAFANQAALAIRNARKAEQLAAIRQVSEAAHRELDITDTLDSATKGLAEMLRVQQAALILFDWEAQTGEIGAEYNDPDCAGCQSLARWLNELGIGQPFPLTNMPLLDWLHDHKKPRRIIDAQNDPLFGAAQELVQRRHTTSMMIVPLLNKREDLIGAIVLDSLEQRRAFTDDEATLSQLVANQIAIAYENAKLFEESARRSKNLATLNSFGQQLTLGTRLPFDDIVAEVYEQIDELLQPHDFYIWLYDETRQMLKLGKVKESRRRRDAHRSLDSPIAYTPHRRTKLEEVIFTRQLVLYNTRRENREFYDEPAHEFPPYTQADVGGDLQASYLAVPMVADEKVIGVISLSDWKQEHAFDQETVQVISALANQAAVALDNARLYGQLQRRVTGLRALTKIGQQLAAQINATEPEIIALIYEQSQNITDCKDMYVAVYDDAADQIRFPFYLKGGERRTIEPRRLHGANQGKTNKIILSRQPLLLHTKAEAETWYDEQGLPGHPNPWPSFLGVPMILEDKAIGVIAIFDTAEAYRFDEVDLEIFSTMANKVAIALNNTQLHAELRQRNAELKQRNVEFKQRNEGLDLLNKVGQQLTSQIRATEEEIFELIYKQTSKLIPRFGQMYVALYDQATNQISFPLFRDKKAPDKTVPLRPLKQTELGKTEAIILSKKPLLHRTKQASEEWYSQPNHQEFVGDMPTSWLGVPMMLAEKVIGVMAIYDLDDEGLYNETDQEILSAMANQAAIAIDNSRLYHDVNHKLERRVNALQALDEVSQQLTQAIRTTEDEMVHRLYHAAQRLTGTQDMYIILYDERDEMLRYGLFLKRGSPDEQAPRKLNRALRSKADDIILTHEPILHKSRQESEAWYGRPGYQPLDGAPPLSYLGVPMRLEDKTIGVLAVYDYDYENVYDEADQEILSAMANTAAIAIDNARLYRDTTQRLTHKEIVQTITNAIYTQPDWIETLYAILKETNAHLGAEAVSFQRLDEATQELIIHASIETEGRLLDRRIPLNETEQRLVSKGSVQKSVYFKKILAACQAEFTAPIRDSEGNLLGIFHLEHSVDGFFDEEKGELAQLIADQAATIIQEARMVETFNRNAQMAALGAAIAAIQHRLNNTISIIRPNVKLLKMSLNLDDVEVAEPIEIIERNTAYASEYIKKMQNFVKESELSLADISSLVRDAHQRIQQQYQDRVRDSEKNIIVEFDMPPADYTARVPLTQTTEVFSNIFENSYNALLRANDTEKRLTVTSQRVEREIVVTIANTGPPIPDAVLERLLTKPVPPKNQREGTGLGLWLSSILLQKMGGSITIANISTSAGVTVEIRIPAIREEREQ